MIEVLLRCDGCAAPYPLAVRHEAGAIRLLRRRAMFDGWAQDGAADRCPSCASPQVAGRVVHQNAVWVALLALLRAAPEPLLWEQICEGTDVGWAPGELELMADLGLLRAAQEPETGWGRYVLAPEEEWPTWCRERFGAPGA